LRFKVRREKERDRELEGGREKGRNRADNKNHGRYYDIIFSSIKPAIYILT
jgi:hypothetical protein